MGETYCYRRDTKLAARESPVTKLTVGSDANRAGSSVRLEVIVDQTLHTDPKWEDY